ncbi:MAG: Gfo/Idh/MocA family oxidoreductase [Candidatus Poribacteria bacterium]|nr:Gfo/Idh/MocA family oxidoreductase [Candidatus Poribacteria bacterium]
MDKVKICLVGTGWTGTNHFNGYKAIPEKATVVAVVAHSDPSKAKVETWEVPKIYRSFDEALKDDEIDAFDLCTPHYLHAEQLLACLQAGKHVMGETPACLTLEECRALRVALFEHPNQKAATGHICRSWPTYAHAKEIASTGEIGDVFYLSSNYAHKPDPNEYPSSQTWGHNPRARARLGTSYHSVDLLRWIAGDVEEVSGDYTDHARLAVLKFKNGAMGKVFNSASVVRPYIMSLSVYGHEGTIVCWWEEEILHGYLHKSAEWNPDRLKSTPLHGRGSPEWAYEMENFVDGILEGKDLVCPLSEGIATVETCLAIEEAMTHSTKVRVTT